MTRMPIPTPAQLDDMRRRIRRRRMARDAGRALLFAAGMTALTFVLVAL